MNCNVGRQEVSHRGMNLKNALYPGKEAHKRGILPGFETLGRRHHKKSKKGYQWPHKNDRCSSILFTVQFP